MHPLPSAEPFFCFSLGFYHCHFTIALCIDTVSYALPSALGYTLYLSLTHYFGFRWGFTIAIWPLDFGYLTRPAQESAQYMKVHLYKRQGQASPGQPWPAQARPAQTRPAQPRLGQASPGQPRSGQASPGQASPGQPRPAQASPGHASLGQPRPALASPGPPRPAQASQPSPASQAWTQICWWQIC